MWLIFRGKGSFIDFILGIVLGGVGGAILLIRRSKGLKDEMAFGPSSSVWSDDFNVMGKSNHRDVFKIL